MIDEVVSTEPAKMEPVEPTIYCIDEVNATSIAEAFSLLVKVGGAKNDAVINRSDLPKLILAGCLGDDNAPRDTIQSIKAISKLNERCTEPLTSGEIADLVDETIEMIFEYIDNRDDVIKQRAAEKKEREWKKAQAEHAAAARVVVPTVDPETAKIAKDIYESGKFIEYCKTSFIKVWLGDTHILTGILLTAANMRVLNAKDGIHLHILGTTQSGKSDSVKAAMQFVHPANKMIKTFSAKYLFYADDELPPSTIVFSDDTTFDPETASLYRNMLTSWFTGVTRGIVVNHAKKDTHIPARVSLILTSVESVVQEGDDAQDESRFLSLEVRRTPKQMAEIRAFVQEDHPDIKLSLYVVNAVWESITPRNVKIHKVIDKDIPIREFKRYLTLVQSHALLCNRVTTTDDDFLAIDQFLTYSKPMINNTTPAFTRKEAAVLKCLTKNKKTVAEIVKESGMCIQDVYRAVRGRNGTFQSPKGGLMVKEPRLEYTQVSSEGANNIHMLGLRS